MNKSFLPKWPFQILNRFCPEDLYEEIEGDLIQKFNKDIKAVGEKRAKRRLVWNVIRFCRPGIVLRNKFSIELMRMDMLHNYFKISFRSLMKRKAYSGITVFGLAVSMAACLIIAKYIAFETSFENNHTNAQNIYRVVSSFYTDGKTEEYGGYDLGPNLVRDFPEVKRFSRVHHNGSVVRVNDGLASQRKFKESHMVIVDSTFLNMFTFEFIHGDSKSALTKPNSIVITKSTAIKYFGTSTNPVGKIVTLDDGWIPGLYEVSAVIEDVPANSHFKFDLLLPMQTLLQTDFYRNDNSRWDNFFTYLELNPSLNMIQLNERIPAFVKRYQGDDSSIKSKSNLQFQPLLDIHYSPDLDNRGNYWKMIYFFVVLAIFILLVALVNYINLSTARAMERAREVGVKKALGVFRSQLIAQFVFESALINLISVSVALILAWLALPLLNQLIGQSLVFDFLDPTLWLIVGVLFMVGSFGAGIYPALVLSSYKTLEVIKGKIVGHSRGFSLRNGLVTFQFSASLVLLIATYTVYKQVTFMKDQKKELDTSQVLIVRGPELSDRKNIEEIVTSFKEQLKQFSFVDKISTSFSLPGEDASTSTGMRREGSPETENRIGNIYWVDPDFIDLYNIPLLEGKTWNAQVDSEIESVIVNEEAVKVFQLGTNKEALKEKIVTPHGTYAIIGVVKNHHWNSLKQPFAPMILQAEKISTASISIKLNGNFQKNIDLIENAYSKSFPENSFSYYFIDDAFNRQYDAEIQIAKLFSAFSILAVAIGCLGLWGLASFATLHRLKEISIRKVLGATVNSILLLLTRQFLRPIIISGLIVFPVIVIGINKWLQQFPYRMSLSFDLFLLPLILLLAIALCTISYQTLGAATSNPMNSLKNE